MWSALSTEALVSNEKRASTSVETLPGIILRIFAAELDEQAVEGGIDLLVNGGAVPLAYAMATSITLAYSGFLAGGQDEGRVGRGILGFVLGNGWTGVSACVQGGGS